MCENEAKKRHKGLLSKGGRFRPNRKIESESDIFLQILSEIIELQENGSLVY